MGMKVNFNISAILANDYLRKTDDNLAASTQRLSSGYKINRAGDNPAGMAIGRRMRSKIKSIAQANQNASDAVSVVTTAEGALNEIHDMLQRMNELSIKAANGTLSGDPRSDEDKALDGRGSTTSSVLTNSDRSLIQEEINQLIDEVERIANTTEFNGRKLLDGSFDLKGYVEKPADYGNDVKDIADDYLSAFVVESYSDEVIPGFFEVELTIGSRFNYEFKDDFDDDGNLISKTLTRTAFDGHYIADMKIVDQTQGNDTLEFNGIERRLQSVFNQKFYINDDRTATIKADNDFSLTIAVDWDALMDKEEMQAGIDDLDPEEEDGRNDYQTMTDADADGLKDDLSVRGKMAIYDPNHPSYNLTKDELGYDIFDVDGTLLNNYADKDEIKEARDNAAEEVKVRFFINLTGMGAMTEQIGSEEGVTLDMRIPKISAKNLGIDRLDVMDADSARESIDRVSIAIDRLSAHRSRLGAYQNRLEHTINSLLVSEESMTTAFSGIMDTDMAKEMTIYSQQQVMSQAGTSMLAQANQRPSQVLQLLQ